jgi:hypothetical protein
MKRRGNEKTPNPAMKFAACSAVERNTVTAAGDWAEKNENGCRAENVNSI